MKLVLGEYFNAFGKLVVKDRERPGKPSEITEEKVDEVHDVCESELQLCVRAVTTACSIPRTTAH
ncbi:unnamed protein product, partial [Rotaria sp. Silwood1]